MQPRPAPRQNSRCRISKPRCWTCWINQAGVAFIEFAPIPADAPERDQAEHEGGHMRHRTKVEDLVHYIVSISVIGAGYTLLLDMLANAAEAPATVRALVVHGSAGVFACAG